MVSPLLQDDASLTDLAGFARSGATCSNFLTPRANFPPIMEWQLPAYLNETYDGTLALNAQETMYTIWIGTNDLGVAGLLTGVDAPGVSIVPVRQCAVDVLKYLYESGARNFIMQNVCRKTMFQVYGSLFILGDSSSRSTSPSCTPRIHTLISSGRHSVTRQSGASSCESSSMPATKSPN